MKPTHANSNTKEPNRKNPLKKKQDIYQQPWCAATKALSTPLLPNKAHEPLLLIKGDISQEKPITFKKNLHVAIISIFIFD